MERLTNWDELVESPPQADEIMTGAAESLKEGLWSLISKSIYVVRDATPRLGIEILLIS